jgi:hypothetical protein
MVWCPQLPQPAYEIFDHQRVRMADEWREICHETDHAHGVAMTVNRSAG